MDRPESLLDGSPSFRVDENHDCAEMEEARRARLSLKAQAEETGELLPQILYGPAIEKIDRVGGVWIASTGEAEYASEIRFCPFCGLRLPIPLRGAGKVNGDQEGVVERV